MAEPDNAIDTDAAGETAPPKKGPSGIQAKVLYWAGVLAALFHLWSEAPT